MPGSFGRVAKVYLRTPYLLEIELFDLPEMTSKSYRRVYLLWGRDECDEVSEEEYDELCRDWVLTHPNY